VQFLTAIRPIHATERLMNGIIYLVGLVVVVMAVLSLIGIH
jgi:small-conductance mechanosensitive channel